MTLGKKGCHDIHVPLLRTKDSPVRRVRRMRAQERLVETAPGVAPSHPSGPGHRGGGATSACPWYISQPGVVGRVDLHRERRDASVLPRLLGVERRPVAYYTVVAGSAAPLSSLLFISFQRFTSLPWLLVVAKEKARRLSAPGPL